MQIMGFKGSVPAFNFFLHQFWLYYLEFIISTSKYWLEDSVRYLRPEEWIFYMHKNHVRLKFLSNLITVLIMHATFMYLSTSGPFCYLFLVTTKGHVDGLQRLMIMESTGKYTCYGTEINSYANNPINQWFLLNGISSSGRHLALSWA